MYIQLQNFGYNSSIKSTYHEGQYECIERIHQFPEIVSILGGSVEITVDGVTEVARKGDIAVITPFRAHSFHTPEYCKIWIGVISSDFASDFISGENMHISGTRAVFTPSVSLSNYVTEHFPDQYETQTSLENDNVRYRSIKALVYTVFEEYTRTVPQVSTKLNKSALVSVLLYMSEHFCEDIDLSDLATALGYTSTYVSHCVSTIPNMNFRKLLNSLRVDHAKNLLISKEFKMIDIALECGYSSERTFYRALQEIVGMTPSEYKKLKRR
ncbi:MAG: helix-turn-helix domain-containing protein [Clostridia bacterium]|nr:helix-turn-helix domain-containing protein [Clostridia bacterium]